MDLHDVRRIELEGAANVRDLGGLPASNGDIVRCGRLFRSDVLYRLTESDTLALQSLGIRTVIDLRSRDEVRLYPQSLLEIAGVPHLNVPIASDVYSETGDIAEDYLILLRNAGAGFREIFGLLAKDRYPVIINCFAGKDRTGLTSALILGALGVPDDVIVADYALSEPHMRRHMRIHDQSADGPDEDVALPSWLEASAVTMEATLRAIRGEWRSVPGYLASIGIPANDLRRIHDALVEPHRTGDPRIGLSNQGHG